MTGALRDAGAPELTPMEILAVTAIAYLQPAHPRRTLAPRRPRHQPRRDRAPQTSRSDRRRAPRAGTGAPYAYVTTQKFLEVFGLASLRDLPDIEKLEDEGLLQRPNSEEMIDGVLGLYDDERRLSKDLEFEGAQFEGRGGRLIGNEPPCLIPLYAYTPPRRNLSHRSLSFFGERVESELAKIFGRAHAGCIQQFVKCECGLFNSIGEGGS